MRYRVLGASRRRGVARAAVLGVLLLAAGACDDLLDVELKHLLTEGAIEGQGTAELQVTSAIGLFECGSSAFGWVALGHEDVLQSIAGVANTAHVWRDVPVTGTCDTASGTQNWFDQFMGARTLISTDPAKLAPSGKGYLERDGAPAEGVYDKLTDGRYQLGAAGERLAAIAAIYMAATLKHFGEFYCEGAIDGSNPVTPAEFLAMAEAWVGRAQGHITAFGDFALPNAAASSANLAALALRAQIRWANGNLAGADADAAAVLAAAPTFTFWVTRESGEQRRNKTFHAATESRFSGMLGKIDWWNPAQRAPNPATGQLWTNPIPFTGYIFLGIGSEGQTFEPGTIGTTNQALTWAEEQRAAGAPVPRANGAVSDTRTPHAYGNVQGPGQHENPTYYSNDSADEPIVSWRELTLIRAEYAWSQGQYATAIGFINTLRTFHSLPEISGAYLASLLIDGVAVRSVILEERRRELYSQGGRYWSTKIQNVDLLWFPRRQGQTPGQGYVMQGGVRLAWATDEYSLNPAFAALGDITAVRGTFCDPTERPTF
jgi:hypothetical protein